MDNYGQAMRNKLMGTIEAGRNNMIATLQDIEREYNIRRDFIATPKGLNGRTDHIVDWDVTPYPDSKYYQPHRHIKPVFDNHGALELTNHSYSQMVSRFKIPSTYVDSLLELGEVDLLKDNLNKMVERRMDTGALIRSVGNKAKGWLSTSYKRYDATPLFEAFIDGASSNGFVPIRAYNTEYRYFLGFVLPEVFEIGEREFVTYGVSMTTGDYGNAAMTIGLLVLRIQCTNLAIGSSILRKVHIGGRIDATDERMLAMLSHETIDKDTKAMASMVKDITKASSEEIRVLERQVKQAAITPVNMKAELEGIKKKFGKTLAEQVDTLYQQDIEDLPKGDSKWRFSSCLSLLANGTGIDADARMDLQKEAARIIESVKAV